MTDQQSNRVFVGNLAYPVRWQDLKDFMAQAGPVAHADVIQTSRGLSRGCGVVEFETVEGARAAIEQLHGQDLQGREVFIREDREPSGVATGSRAPGAGSVPPSHAVFVENLAYSTNWTDLKDHFRSAGPVLRADVHMSQNRSKGRGTVVFEQEEGARNAIETLNGSLLHGRNIRVREDLPQAERRNAAPAPIVAPVPSASIVVNNLPWSTTDEDLALLVGSVAAVVGASVQFLPNGKSAGYGLVQTASVDHATMAIQQLNGTDYGERKLAVSYGN